MTTQEDAVPSEPTLKQSDSFVLPNQGRDSFFYPLTVKADNLQGIRVFKDLYKTRRLVGRLIKRDLPAAPFQQFIFSYNSFYKGLSLAPHLSVTRSTHFSSTLFPYFVKRLPDKTKATYQEQCFNFNLDLTEDDPFVLLSTIGRTGKDPFVFEPYFKETFSTEEVLNFMNKYELAVPDICLLFDLSTSSMNKIKRGAATGKLVLRKMELILNTPEAMRYCFLKNRQWINPKKLGLLENDLFAFHSNGEKSENFNENTRQADKNC